MAIIATPGAANANSYATQVEADAYHDGLLFTDVWTAAIALTKEKALRMATRLIDNYFTWLGSRTYPLVQALDFPRTGLFRDAIVAVDATTIPSEIRDATSEFARYLMANDPSAVNEATAQGITQIKVGPIELRFKDVIESKVIPDHILLMIPPEWYVGGIVEDDLKTSIFQVV